MEKMGGLGGLMGMMPGVGKAKKQMAEAGMDDKVIRRQVAIINSMTKQERRKPEILKASRKKRVAAGSGTKVEEVNKLLKMHRQMADMMKQMGRKKGGLMGGLGAMMGGGPPQMPQGGAGGGMPQMDPKEMERLARQMPQGPGGGMPGLGGGMPGLGGPGTPGGMPGLPGAGGSGRGKGKRQKGKRK